MSGCMGSQLVKFVFWFMTSRSHVPNGQQQHLVRVGKTFPVVAQPMSWVGGCAAYELGGEKLRIRHNSASWSWQLAELGNKKYGQSVGKIFILVLDQLFPSPKWQFIVSSIFSSLSTKALF